MPTKKKGKRNEKDEKVFSHDVGNGDGAGNVFDDVCGRRTEDHSEQCTCWSDRKI